MHGDDEPYGSVQRVELFDKYPVAVTLTDDVGIMNRAASEDVRSPVWPIVRRVLQTGTAPNAAIRWSSTSSTIGSIATRLGSTRQRHVLRRARPGHHGRLWRPIADAVMSPVVGGLIPDLDNVRNLDGLEGESYVDKDLRTLLGRSGRRPVQRLLLRRRRDGGVRRLVVAGDPRHRGHAHHAAEPGGSPPLEEARGHDGLHSEPAAEPVPEHEPADVPAGPRVRSRRALSGAGHRNEQGAPGTGRAPLAFQVIPAGRASRHRPSALTARRRLPYPCRTMLRILALLLWGVAPAVAQVAGPAAYLGSIAGPGSVVAPSGVRFYGTDLGWTFEHRGTHYMLFGDTWPHDRSMCEPLPHNDDSQATLPLAMPVGLPPLTIATDPDAPAEFARIRLFTDGESQVMGYNKTPLTAWSDGTDAVVLFGLIDLVRCGTKRGRPSCRPYEHLTCSQDVGICSPPTLGYDAPCDLATGAGCIIGQTCEATPTGLCIDPDSSQNDGTSASLPAMAAYHTHLGIQDAARPSDYRDVGTIASNKFIDVTARTVRCFTGTACGNDYTPGHGAVFVWGRPATRSCRAARRTCTSWRTDSRSAGTSAARPCSARVLRRRPARHERATLDDA
jgi:hypothetical protein